MSNTSIFVKCIKVTTENQHIYFNLIQSYEAEFSPITGKKPNVQGLFELDTQLDAQHSGFIVYVDDLPAGIAAIATKQNQQFEVCEFYVVPYYRKQAVGKQFAHQLWQQYIGYWEVKQIQGAEYATQFWRKVIATYTNNQFNESQYQDEYWGAVTRQTFYS
ncbi:hypothetical protein [Candidatus Albibeggiatoa sp. nov. NOAA]|uniref:GNAT family N-acetyltransferase n=1 Tax=Candidatus Albibeggiatoa sp. nov. NOAA TaxID=3162724 RepID=UPI0032FCE248|nr:hypothetical protein [Thiotrichaceae bacterium]